jgi:transposase-like protein
MTVAGLTAEEEDFARGLMERAKAEGVSLVGPGGLLSGLTKTVLETALEAELTEDLGYEPHEPARRNSGNSRNGARAKTVLTEVGPVEIDVPRDRNGTFEPKLVRKRQRRMTGVDDLVISLVAKGLTTGEVCAHLAEIYGAEVTKDTVSRITDRVLEGMAEWQNRPLDRVYPVIFIDAIHVKIRDGGAVGNRPIYTAVGVTVDGERDILGLWAGTGGEGAKFWLHVLTEIKNRGVADACIVVCDGLSGLPEAIQATWSQALVQTCVIHLRNSFRYASRKHWPAIAKDLKPIYTAPTEAAALERFGEFAGSWESRYPAIVKLWENAWEEFTPFLRFDPEIRTIIYTTNSIESLNARFRRAVRARGHFPNEQAALKCLFLTVVSLDPTGIGRQRWTNRWKPALNAFAIAFPGRIIPTTKYS